MTMTARLRSIPGWQVTLALALLALGFLIVAQLQSEGPRVRYTTQERQPLVQTALGLQSQQEALKQRILDLRAQIQDLETRTQGSAVQVRALNDALQQAQIAGGLVALQGPGLVLQLEDSTLPVPPEGNASDYLVSARDLRTVVEQLWLAGAEAVSINGERVTVSTAILDIGGSVLANSAYLSPPYQVSAVGAPGLYDQLSHARGFVDFVKARAEGFQIRIKFAELPDVAIPAYAGTLNLRYSRPEPSPALPGASAPAPGASAVP